MGLRDAHFFRKVPNDVTEATKVGGLISVLAVVTIFWLVRQEYAEFAAPKHVSVLSLDTSTLPSPLGAEAFENIRINFNITMLRMPCQYATLQIADHVGSHKVGGTRNVHKVMLDANGRSLGVYTPHRYHTEGPGAEPEHMADHVFPWHKQMHTQGDAAHREAQGKAHMSLEQAEHVRGVEAEMEKGSAVKPGGAKPGARRLLSFEPIAAAAAAAQAPTPPAAGSTKAAADKKAAEAKAAAEKAAAEKAAAEQLAADAKAAAARIKAAEEKAAAEKAAAIKLAEEKATREAAEAEAAKAAAAATTTTPPATAVAKAGSKPTPLADLDTNCGEWAGALQCDQNAAYMLSHCETSCASRASEAACAAWAAAAMCDDAGAKGFMGRFCAASCRGAAVAAKVDADVVLANADADDGSYVPSTIFSGEPSAMEEAEFEAIVKANPGVMVNFMAPWCFWSNKLTPDWLACGKRLHKRAYSQSVGFLRVDCTKSRKLCETQMVQPTSYLPATTYYLLAPTGARRRWSTPSPRSARTAAPSTRTSRTSLGARRTCSGFIW